MCLWPTETWTMHLFSEAATSQHTVLSLYFMFCEITSVQWRWGQPPDDNFLLPTFKIVLPTFGTFCPFSGGWLAQSLVHFGHFQVKTGFGPGGSASCSHCAHTHDQVSLYRHLSIGPRDRKPIWCRLHLRSARLGYNCLYVDPVPIYVVKFRYTAIFHWGLKIASRASFEISQPWLWPDRYIAL